MTDNEKRVEEILNMISEEPRTKKKHTWEIVSIILLILIAVAGISVVAAIGLPLLLQASLQANIVLVATLAILGLAEFYEGKRK